MNKSLAQSFEKLEQQKAQLLELLNNLSAEAYYFSPSPDKWSIAEILTHLLTSEQLTLAYMRKKVSVIKEQKNSGLGSAFRLWILFISQRIPLKYKAPKVIVDRTPKALPLDEFKIKWKTLRSELRQLLDGIEEWDRKKLIFKHPMAGKFNAIQAIIFLGEHINHHLPQIKRLIK